MSDFNTIAEDIEKLGIAISIVDIASIRPRMEDQKHEELLKQKYLSQNEIAYTGTMRIFKRRCDFISGRIAGKQAVMRFIKAGLYKYVDNSCADIPFADIDIIRTDTGEPRVSLDNTNVGMLISISHSPDFAVSAVCGNDKYRGIGIDIEKIEKRDDSVMDVAFCDEEISRIRDSSGNCPGIDESFTRYWAAKEAALKSMGIGLNVDLKDLEVVDDNDAVRIILKNDAQDRIKELGGNRIDIKLFTHNDHVMAVAYMK